MLFTRKGDDGTSGLFGTPERFPKDAMIFEALGAVDELNSLLGVCFSRAKIIRNKNSLMLGGIVRRAQENLFIVQAELAGAQKTLSKSHVDRLERDIAEIEGHIENPHSFIIPGATELSALFDYARAVSRRAERHVVAARGVRPVSAHTYQYLNRLSSLLYVLARYAALKKGTKEDAPSY